MFARKHPLVDKFGDILIIFYMFNERLFYVRPANQRTAAKWFQATGRELLPVRSSEPAMTPAGCLAYRVDASRLTANERTRLIGYLVLHCWMGSKRMTYDEARLAVVEGVPVAAADCELVQEQESAPAPAFVLGRVMQPALFFVLKCFKMKRFVVSGS